MGRCTGTFQNSVGKGGFDSCFDSASVSDIHKVMADPNTKNAIPNALRNGGGFHEWFLVLMTDKAKALGFTTSELKGLQLLLRMYGLKIFLALKSW